MKFSVDLLNFLASKSVPFNKYTLLKSDTIFFLNKNAFILKFLMKSENIALT